VLVQILEGDRMQVLSSEAVEVQQESALGLYPSKVLRRQVIGAELDNREPASIGG
jgi:hypothetical protein